MPYFWIADFWEFEPKICESPKLFSDGLISNCGGKFGSPMGVVAFVGKVKDFSSAGINRDKVLLPIDFPRDVG